jgi:nucleoside-diphosphate-sugar epimerase
MSEMEKPHRFIVIGKGGGFSQEIVRQIHLDNSKSASYNLSTRDINSRDSRSQIDTFLATHEQFKDTIIWCAGSSSNRSSISDCNNDETKLHEFMETILTSSCYAPNLCYLSSGGSVYGKSPGVVSEISPLNPQSAYAEMKIHSEEFLARIASSGRIGVYIFRVANVYGSAQSSNRTSIVQAALENPEILLTVNASSRKQYGTYQDYSKFILNYIVKSPLNPGSMLIQNVYSEHDYSISEILEITRPYGAFKDRKVIQELGSLNEYENVQLISVHPESNLDIRWRSLEDYVRTVD